MKTTKHTQADEALTSARVRLEFLITALKGNDADKMEWRIGDVMGLVAILEDVNKTLEIPDNHLHELVMDEIHGPSRRDPEHRQQVVARLARLCAADAP